MLVLNKNLNINLNGNKNYRCLSKYKSEFVFTVFPHKKIYILDDNYDIVKEISTQYFYGSVTFNGNHFICGCYSSLCCEIHILDESGTIIKRINYRKFMPQKYIDDEQFISFCHSTFCINNTVYFVLKNSKYIYYISNDTVIGIDLSKYFSNKNIVIHCACQHKNNIIAILSVENNFFICKFTENEKQVVIMDINNLINKTPTNIEYINNGFYVVFEDVKDSSVKLLLDEL